MTKARKLFAEAPEYRVKRRFPCGSLDHNRYGTHPASACGEWHEEAPTHAHGKKERIPRQTLSNQYILKGADWVPRININ